MPLLVHKLVICGLLFFMLSVVTALVNAVFNIICSVCLKIPKTSHRSIERCALLESLTNQFYNTRLRVGPCGGKLEQEDLENKILMK